MKHFTNTLPLILLAAPALAMTPATGQAQTSERGLLEEVIVTAQKREQNIQDVPVSVTALSADSIVANRIHDVSDLGNVVPNLTIRPSPGGNMIPQYSLRGIFTYGTALGTDKGVSVYIDGVYMQNASGSTFEMADIDQIEVLRGPQGTLFGRNSTGGAINIRTRKPSGEFNIHQELTTGNYAQFRSKTRLDLPRKGPLSMSISYLHSEREGDIRNLGAGTAWDHGPASGGAKGVLTSPKRLGDKNINSVFVAADLDLHDNFDLSYKFDLANTNFTPDATGVVYMPSMSVLGLGVTPEEIPRLLAASSLYASSPSELTPVTNKRPKAVNNWWSTNGDSKVYGHNLTANWRLNDWATLKNILAYRKMTVYVNFQLDGMGGLYAPGTGDTVPLLLVATNGGSTEKQWSDELQLNITRDQFSLTAGLIHFQNDQEVAGIPGEFNTLAGAAIVGQGTPLVGTPFVVPANTGYFLPNVKSKSDAFYIQPEIHLTDQVDFVLGYRVTRDDKKGRDVVPGSVQPYSPSMGNYTLVRYKDTRDTYMVGLNYKPVDNVLTYAKYATGFISGGQLATIVFAPEKAKSFEVGVKSELFERRLRSNLSVFHVDYDSIQQVVLGARAGIPAAVPYGQAVIPAADATAYGFEWENTYVPLEGLMLGLNLGYTHFKYDKNTVFSGFVNTHGVPGFQEYARPRWVNNLFVQYNGPRILAGGYFSARADGQFISKQLINSDTTPGETVNSLEDPLMRAGQIVGDQWLANARLALSDIPIGNLRMEVSLWGKNLFDNRNAIQTTPLVVNTTAIYQPARTYGLDLSFDF